MIAAEHPGDRSIAVVTVCRNPGTLLAQAVDSVRGLNDSRIRHIIIDGASTDGTAAYLKSVEESIYHWSSEPDRGIYDAMNKGWAVAPPDSYVVFIGADDRLLGVPSAEELRWAEDSGHPIIFGTTQVGSILFRSRLDSTIRWRNTLHHQSLLIRKDLSPSPPFNECYRVYGDWDFNVRLWQARHRAFRSEALRSYADARGASAAMPLGESFRVGFNNSGVVAGVAAWIWAVYASIRKHRKASSES